LTGVPLDPPDSTLTLYTDASLTWWGTFLEGRTVSGVWEDCHLEHINLLEMRAVLLSFEHFQEVIQRQSLLIATDNATMVTYLQNQGELTPVVCIFYVEKLCCYATVSRQCWQWDIYKAIRIYYRMHYLDSVFQWIRNGSYNQ
jgi:hypothetical protein